ncbi:MAG: LacI family DNA-binding transcriptional regulator [Alloprevotella sp.]|nr:LacI family DNA-binding transcriptional regulator [Alloprevotella sp.]
MFKAKENEIFKQMLDWIYANTEAHNQSDVARRAGVNVMTISRALDGKVKKVKQETLRKINNAFGNVFNPEWLRGGSDTMLVADLQPSSSDAPTDSSGGDTPTTNSLINAVLAAKDETIASLKRELDAKDALISLLREQLAKRTGLSKV